MLNWDETDILECLEVQPEVETDGIWYRYTVEHQSLKLVLLIYPYDSDVFISLYGHGQDEAALEMNILECPEIRFVKSKNEEYLEFAQGKIHGLRYSAEPHTSQGVRLWAHPSIRIVVY